MIVRFTFTIYNVCIININLYHKFVYRNIDAYTYNIYVIYIKESNQIICSFGESLW